MEDSKLFTILVADDNADLRTILATFLRHRGYQVHEAASGEGAVAILTSVPIDIVITDMHLPGNLHGVDVLYRHRKTNPNGERILLTAVMSNMLWRVCQYLDTIYLQKPFPLDELVRKLEGFRSLK
jgi:CheY-like chemotaxis protein